jgi:hypothetical protein
MYTTHDPTGAHLIHIHGIKRLLVDLFVAYQKPDRCGITLYSKGQVMRVTLRAMKIFTTVLISCITVMRMTPEEENEEEDEEEDEDWRISQPSLSSLLNH